MLRRGYNALGVGLACLAVAVPASAGQAETAAKAAPAAKAPAPAAARKFVAKRLPWGDPDISGNFTTKEEGNVPFERPDEFAGKRIEDITPAELAKANEQRRRDALANAPYAGGGSRARGVALAVPIHWFDTLDTENTRPWFVVDPPDGKIPPVNVEGRKRQTDLAAFRSTRGTHDSYTDRSPQDRCISWTIGIARVVPIIYGNSVQIMQGKDYVAIRYEMVHETRIIPIQGRVASRGHNPAIVNSYWGDAIGKWDGDTFVVDTTNYNGKLPFRGSGPKLHTVERFRRVAPNKIDWSATVEDPGTWDRPWTYAIPWTEDDSQPIFEYACHEGNYGLRNILSAGRSDDAKGIRSSNTADAQADLKGEGEE
jgi:hypothetical protein